MSNYPDGMTRSDLIAVGEIDGPLRPFETRVLRAVVYLTYDGRTPEFEDEETIEEEQSPAQAERAIKRALDPRDIAGGRTIHGLHLRPDNIEVVDAEYMSPEEADNR